MQSTIHTEQKAMTALHLRHELASVASGLFTVIDTLRVRPHDFAPALGLLEMTREKLVGLLNGLEETIHRDGGNHALHS